jgi:hypothetical protein
VHSSNTRSGFSLVFIVRSSLRCAAAAGQVLADVPPTARCPKCRQRYVFREVLELHEFGAVIRFKCVTLALTLATQTSVSARIQSNCDWQLHLSCSAAFCLSEVFVWQPLALCSPIALDQGAAASAASCILLVSNSRQLHAPLVTPRPCTPPQIPRSRQPPGSSGRSGILPPAGGAASSAPQ